MLVFLPVLGLQYADLNRHVDALNAWRNATVLKPEHSLAWNNMIILLDSTGARGMPRLCSGPCGDANPWVSL